MSAIPAHADHDALASALAALPPPERWRVIRDALAQARPEVAVTIPGAVVSKNRALMFGRGGVYRTAESHAYQDTAAMCARMAMRHREPLKGRLAAVLTLSAPDRRSMPDADNASKSPLDACRQIVYGDDRQIDVLMVERIVVPRTAPSLRVGLDVIA